MAGQSEVRAWLIQEAGISAERIDALLQMLNEEEVDTVHDLQILSNAPRFDIRLTAVTGQKIRDALARRRCDTASAPLITPSAAELQPPAADGNLSGRASEALLAAGALALASPQSPPPSASSGELAAALLPARAAPTPPIAVNKAKRPTHIACFGCQLQQPSTPTDQLTQLPAPSKGPFEPADRICEQCRTSGLRIARPRVHGVKFLTELRNPGGAFKTEPWFCLKDYGTSPPLAYTNSSPRKLDSAAEKRCSVIILKNEADWPSVLEATMDSGKVVRRTLGEKLVEIPLQWFDDDRLCFVWSGRAEQFILGRSTTQKRKAGALTGQSAAQLLVTPPPADTPAPPTQLAAASAATSPAPSQEGAPDLDDSVSDFEENQAGWLSVHGALNAWLDHVTADEANRAIILNNGAAGTSGGGASGGGASGGDPSGSGGAAYRSLGGADEGEVPPVMRSLGSEGELVGPTAFTSVGGTEEAGEAEAADEADKGEEISELLEQAGEHLRYGALRAAKAVLRRVKALKGM